MNIGAAQSFKFHCASHSEYSITFRDFVLAFDCSNVGLKVEILFFTHFLKNFWRKIVNASTFGRFCRFLSQNFKLRAICGSEQGKSCAFLSVIIRFGFKTGGDCLISQKLLRQVFDASTWAQNNGKYPKASGEKYSMLPLLGSKQGGI